MHALHYIIIYMLQTLTIIIIVNNYFVDCRHKEMAIKTKLNNIYATNATNF